MERIKEDILWPCKPALHLASLVPRQALFPLSLQSAGNKGTRGLPIQKHIPLRYLPLSNTTLKWICVLCVCFFELKDSTIKTLPVGVLVKTRMHTAILELVAIPEESLVSSVIVEVGHEEGTWVFLLDVFVRYSRLGIGL